MQIHVTSRPLIFSRGCTETCQIFLSCLSILLSLSVNVHQANANRSPSRDNFQCNAHTLAPNPRKTWPNFIHRESFSTRTSINEQIYDAPRRLPREMNRKKRAREIKRGRKKFNESVKATTTYLRSPVGTRSRVYRREGAPASGRVTSVWDLSPISIFISGGRFRQLERASLHG